ncbi:hypothetical protein DPMN_152719 [Dreissena polymorpha]|uniref:Uncharacterized protein n=1 Tax=Dreissena polymorpha TaxID=45954 RepID=A0A9D4J446_DREPO|nr:hypothetical protein DPMN_152719 [Dreissena polymorpha]
MQELPGASGPLDPGPGHLPWTHRGPYRPPGPQILVSVFWEFSTFTHVPGVGQLPVLCPEY